MGIVAAKLMEHYKAEAKEWMLSGRPSKDKPMDRSPPVNKGTARDKAGAAVGVSGKSASPQILLWKIYHNKKVNRDRRHLSPSQLADVGAKLRDIFDAEARQQYEENVGRPAKGSEKESVVNLPPISKDERKAREKAGKAVGVSGKSIDHATKVHRKGTPALQEALSSGKVAVSKAAKLRGHFDEEARKRQGRRNDIPANLPECKDGYGDSRDQAAKAVGVSGKSIDHGTKVLKNGTRGGVKNRRVRWWKICHQRNMQSLATGRRCRWRRWPLGRLRGKGSGQRETRKSRLIPSLSKGARQSTEPPNVDPDAIWWP